jgi:hypothetical protein
MLRGGRHGTGGGGGRGGHADCLRVQPRGGGVVMIYHVEGKLSFEGGLIVSTGCSQGGGVLALCPLMAQQRGLCRLPASAKTEFQLLR